MTTLTISRNISEAVKKGFKYHVISENEIHSFNNKKDAKKDLSFGKRTLKNSSHGGKIELLSQQQIERLLN